MKRTEDKVTLSAEVFNKLIEATKEIIPLVYLGHDPHGHSEKAQNVAQEAVEAAERYVVEHAENNLSDLNS